MREFKLKAVLFVGGLLALGIANGVYFDDSYISYTENRRLAPWPEWSYEDFFSGAYTTGIDDFLRDRFLYREAWIDLSTKLSSFQGLKTQDDFVLLTTNGANEAAAGEEKTVRSAKIVHDVAHYPDDIGMLIPVKPEKGVDVSKVEFSDDYKTNILIYDQKGMTSYVYKPDTVDRLAEAYNHFSDNYLDKLKVYVLMAPSPVAFVDDDYARYTDNQYDAIQQFYDGLEHDIVKIDPYSALAAHQDEYIYFRTDHHWTSLGAYYAYTEACKKMGFKPYDLTAFDELTDIDFLGSIYNLTQSDVLKTHDDKISAYVPKANVTYKVFTSQSTLDYDSVISEDFDIDDYKYKLFLGGDFGLAVIDNLDQPENGETLMIIKDSYGNALTPYFVNHFKRIVVVDLRYTSKSVGELVNEYGVNRLMLVNSGQALAAESYADILENVN
ncbi:MAG: hypothetical protein PWP51_900 [Clostridiales bacterium]|jgi:hypothetical protein|nr:hypothetical protein [Clostridiales bacterium]MDN5298347.1 hypothetical protein [Clostridiales bacterium]